MDEVQEDDDYSDDDLDALPADAFHELQENAIRSTQQPNTRRNGSPPTSAWIPTKSTANLTGAFGGLPFGGVTSRPGHVPAHPEPPSSDYGDFDDEMLDGEIYDAAEEPALPISRNNTISAGVAGDGTQREGWRQQRYGAPPQFRGYKGQQPPRRILDLEMQDQKRAQNVSFSGHQPDEMHVHQGGEDVESLRAQVQEVCQSPETPILVSSNHF